MSQQPFSEQLGGLIRRYLVEPTAPAAVRTLHAGWIPSGLVGAGLGGLLGYGGTKVLNLMRRRDRGPVSAGRAALLGALAGGGAGVGASYAFNRGLETKQAFFMGGGGNDATGAIIQSLMGDANIPQMTKAHMVNLVHLLGPQETSMLAQMIQRGMGASAGFIVARFLLGLNMGGSMLAGLLGGAISGPGQRRNAFGQVHF